MICGVTCTVRAYSSRASLGLPGFARLSPLAKLPRPICNWCLETRRAAALALQRCPGVPRLHTTNEAAPLRDELRRAQCQVLGKRRKLSTQLDALLVGKWSSAFQVRSPWVEAVAGSAGRTRAKKAR